MKNNLHCAVAFAVVMLVGCATGGGGSDSFGSSCNGFVNTGLMSLRTTAMDVAAPGVTGQVDSSLIDRNGVNLVYVFAGSAVPDDRDGDAGDPVAVIPVLQAAGGCTWHYGLGAMAAGTYTLAFTADGAGDDAGSNDDLAFSGTANVVVAGALEEQDFGAANVLRVGPGRALTSPSAAAAVARDGDVVEIDSAEYLGDVAVWFQEGITLRGVGGFAHLRANGNDAEGKAIWVIKGDNALVENVEFSEATVPDRNGAGIRQEGNHLTVCNGYFHDNENGILGGGGDVLIEYSEFARNGFGDGYSHNMYIVDSDRFTLRYSYSHHARIGHNVKSRAAENHILYNRIMDETDGDSSYLVDVPNGGLTYIIGNVLHQGVNTDNEAMIAYGAEGLSSYCAHELYVVNNTFVNDLGGGHFINVAVGTGVAQIVNNLMVGDGTPVNGPGTAVGNLNTAAPGLVAIDTFNYRLLETSPARDAGSDNGVDSSLLPVAEYVHPTRAAVRSVDGAIDIGAYEYTP